VVPGDGGVHGREADGAPPRTAENALQRPDVRAGGPDDDGAAASMSKSIRSPDSTRRNSRMLFGMVTRPLLVTVVLGMETPPYHELRMPELAVRLKTS
jgi:hypothetical protein